MSSRSHNFDGRAPSAELGEQLRAAIEQVRQQSPPAGLQDRLLERAQEIPRNQPRPWAIHRALFVTATALAAAVLLIVTVQPQRTAPSTRTGPKGIAQPVDAPASNGPSEERVVEGPHRVLVSPGQFALGRLAPDDQTTISVGQVRNHWGDWERIIGLESLGHPLRGQGALSYLRYQTRASHLDPMVSWTSGARPLGVGRVFSPQDGKALKLQGLYVQVKVEGPRARTLVDHIFYNGEDVELNGTFEMSVPDGATPSYFAFFPGNKTLKTPLVPGVAGGKRPPPEVMLSPEEVMRRIDCGCWGYPREAQIVPWTSQSVPPPEPGSLSVTTQELALSAPEAPTFRGSIGAILPRNHVRLLVAYEEMLVARGNTVTYQYPLPDVALPEVVVTLEGARTPGAESKVLPEGSQQTITAERIRHVWRWKHTAPPGPITLETRLEDTRLLATSGRVESHHYLLARVRPELPPGVVEPPFARHAVFLLDTSAGENAARFDRSVKLMRAILEGDREIQHFNVLPFSTGAAWLDPEGWMTNNPAGRDRALAGLEGTLLEGATDLSAALDVLNTPQGWLRPDTAVHCFLLSDGKLSAGELQLTTLVDQAERQARFAQRWHCYLMGLSEENVDLYAMLSRRGGGIYRCTSEKELSVAARGHRQPCLTIDRIAFEGGPIARDQIVAGRRTAVPQGGDILLAARFAESGRTTLVIEGHVGEKRVRQRMPVAVEDRGQLAPRAWAELAVHSLLGANDPRLEPLALHYAQQFGVPSRISCFALGEHLPTTRPRDERPHRRDLNRLVEESWKPSRTTTDPARLRGYLRDQVENWGANEEQRRTWRKLVGELPEQELVPPPARPIGGITRRKDVDARYIAWRQENTQDVQIVLDEVERRRNAGQHAAAVRLLCGQAEEHAGNPDMLRVVGARLVVMQEMALAIRLLSHLVDQYPQDPAAHRALAIAWCDAGYVVRAVLHYEITLALLGDRAGWLGAVREEYAFLLRKVLRDERLGEGILGHARRRLRDLDAGNPSGVVVSVTWNSVASAIALDVTEATGKTTAAAEPPRGSNDLRSGPRRIHYLEPPREPLTMILRLSRASIESMPETLGTLHVLQEAGTANETLQVRRVLLRREGERGIEHFGDR